MLSQLQRLFTTKKFAFPYKLNPIEYPQGSSEIYKGAVLPEFDHIDSQQQKDWLYNRYEQLMTQQLSPAQRINGLRLLIMAENFEEYVQKKFMGYKRYSGEGTESLVPIMYQMLQTQSQNIQKGASVISIAHRGKLALLVSLFNYPLHEMFYKIKGNSVIPKELNDKEYYFIDDIATHLSGTFQRSDIPNIKISMLPNPSHLEVGGAVGMGKSRAKIDAGIDTSHIWIHGDAGLSGQGVVYEATQMAHLDNFQVGGTVHIVTNNQIGFTTPQEQGRSSKWTTDVFKIIDSPVVHVNGQSIDEVLKMGMLSMEYRLLFKNDFAIDLIGYRRRGHNEVDEPAITNPLLYKQIRENMKGCASEYADRLISEGIIKQDKIDQMRSQLVQALDAELIKADSFVPTLTSIKENKAGFSAFRDNWSRISPFHNSEIVNTGFDIEKLKEIGRISVQVPQDIQVNGIVAKSHIGGRLKQIEQEKIDWSTAEALAFGSLLQQNYNVRLIGQDSIRGTFTQRHAGITCQDTEKVFFPLSQISPGKFTVGNSILSELAVIGFELGYSWDSPNNLVMWEAQFGDFTNMAQGIIDQYIANTESKWLKQSGLILLMPHGQEAQGPDHSSGRLERNLQLVNNPLGSQVNLEVINSVIPSNYFHLLRRSMLRDFRRPILMCTPKSGLRHKHAVSSLEDFGENTAFKPVIFNEINNGSQDTLILCSGKVYLDILSKFPDNSYSIALIEQLAPFPQAEIQQLKKQKKFKKFVWVQEEPINQGAYSYFAPLFEQVFKKKLELVSQGPLPGSGIGNSKEYQSTMADFMSRVSKLLN